MVSSDYRKEAREKLSGKWKKAVCIFLVFTIIICILNCLENIKNSTLKSLISLLETLISVPLSFGLVISFLGLYKDETVEVLDFCKTGFENFKRAWGVTLNTLLKMLVPVIIMLVVLIGFPIISIIMFNAGSNGYAHAAFFRVLSVIGTIATLVSVIWAVCLSYYYKLANYIAIENETMTTKEAVEESRSLMEGKRAKLFFLELSFIGWIILSAFTFFIGLLWVVPYIQFAEISFYKDLVSGEPKEEVEEPVVTEE